MTSTLLFGKDDMTEELKVLQQIRKWSRDKELGLDLAFCETLDEIIQPLAESLEIVVETFSVDVVIKWDCPVCETDNKTNESYYHDSTWRGTCRDCETNVELRPK